MSNCLVRTAYNYLCYPTSCEHLLQNPQYFVPEATEFCFTAVLQSTPRSSAQHRAYISLHTDSSRCISDKNWVSLEFRGVTSTVWAPPVLRENGKPSWLIPVQASREAVSNMTQLRQVSGTSLPSHLLLQRPFSLDCSTGWTKISSFCITSTQR